MRRLVPILRCKCTRCATATRTLFSAIFAICIAIAGGWILLVEVPKTTTSFDEQFRIGTGQEISSGRLNEYFAVDQAPESVGLRSSNPTANADASGARSYLSKSGLSRERLNAALAAGLIDPSRIGSVDDFIPGPGPATKRAITLSGPGVSIQNPGLEMESGAPLVTVAVGMSTASAAANPTKTIDPVSSLAIDKITSTPSRQSPVAVDRMPAPKHRKASILKDKSFSVRLIKSAGIGSPGNSSAQENASRNSSSPNGGKTEPSNDPRADHRDSHSRDLSENLQRFASEFVRANQTDNFAEQHRFFADSVHFYQEGDLSLASVAAASRRYHRDQHTKAELAGPAVATGPVNGGFFVIEQPVRRSQMPGSKVAPRRSVLRLRVVPISHGGWKITSIDEVDK